MNPLFLNTVLLGGRTAQKLAAAQRAGFDQVELWSTDVKQAGGTAAVLDIIARSAIGFTDYQVLLDFDGAPGDKRTAKRREALAMLDTAATLGVATVLVPASTDPACERDRVAEDLAWLVREAKARGRRIAYEGMAWSTLHPTIGQAWAAIRDLDPAYAGLVLDSYHLFVRGDDERAIDAIPVERIFLTQFSDIAGPIPLDRARDVGRHRRLLPGQGILPLARLARRLLDRGYAGPLGLEVFNDELHAREPAVVAEDAIRSLRALLAFT